MTKPKKNAAAVELGKLRAATMTFEERSRGGKAGGAARATALTERERKAIAQKAARARWAKKKPAKGGKKEGSK